MTTSATIGDTALLEKTGRFESTHAVTRVQSLEWQPIHDELNAHGCARLEGVLTGDECDALVRSYPDDQRFRSRVVMARHGFGRGEYNYVC